MVQNSTNQNHYQHQQPIGSSTFFSYINNKIRPTSTINIIINIRNMPNSTTRENQHEQNSSFLQRRFASQPTSDIAFKNKTRSTIWDPTSLDHNQSFVPRNSNHRACWEGQNQAMCPRGVRAKSCIQD